VRNLIFCVRDGGNYLLNIGPRGDGSVPEEPMRVLTEVGRWLSANGETIYKAEPCQVRRSAYANFTRIGNTLFMHVYCWPGGDVALSGLRTKVKTARFFRSNEEIKFSRASIEFILLGFQLRLPIRRPRRSRLNASPSRPRIVTQRYASRSRGPGWESRRKRCNP
jgi:alpha-L-fucosidase